MAPRIYTNFDLLLEPGEAGQFRARVLDSPAGHRSVTTFALPFDPTTLENLLLKLDPGRSGTRRASVNPQIEAGRQLGSALFEAVFSGDIALAWSRSRDLAAAQGQGLRLRLHLADAPAIAGLPWELLHDQRSNTYLAQSERTPVVRFLDVPHVQPPLPVEGALQILVVISSPTDHPDLNVEAEWEHVQEALSRKIDSGRVQVHRLPAPTMTELGRWLRQHRVHVLHFIGHGDYDDRLDAGVLYFCDEYSRSSPVTASVLGPYVHDHDPLRLIVLNSCRSASVDSTDYFGGMAQGLVQQHASAVVAMQFPITDRAAASFTGEFYGAVADGFPVDQAVTYARKALLAGYGAEWATPTVFLNTGDGQVFDPVEAPTEMGETTEQAEVESDTTADEIAPVDEADIGLPPAVQTGPPRQSEPPDDAQERIRRGALLPPRRPLIRRPIEASLDQPTNHQPTVHEPTVHEPAVDQPAVDELAGHDLAAPPKQSVDETAAEDRDLLDELAEDPKTGVYAFGRAQRPVPRRKLAILGAAAGAALLVPGLAYLALQWGDAEVDPTGEPAPEPTVAAVSPTTGSDPDPPTTPPSSLARAAQPGAWVYASVFTTPPTIDGYADDWAGIHGYDTWFSVVEPGQRSGVMATWSLGWDADYYYVFVDVEDDTITQTHAADPAQLWRGDSVHFEFGIYQEEVRTDALDPGDLHVMLGPTDHGEVLIHFNVASGANLVSVPAPMAAQAAVQVWDGGYSIEAAIAWDELMVTDVVMGDLFVTNLNVSDARASGSDVGDLDSMWSNNADRLHNSVGTRYLWGVVELSE